MLRLHHDGVDLFDFPYVDTLTSPAMRPFLITASQAGKLLGLTRQRVADLTRSGDLPVATHTPGGQRRYDIVVIQCIAEKRAAAKAAARSRVPA